MIFLLTLPFRLLGLGFKTGRGTVRLFGLRRLFVFGLGVGVGVLFAPGPGAELRAKLRAAIDDLQAGSAGTPRGTADLVTRVRDELASSPRTWHLPQPSVTLDGVDRVVLAGDVPDDTAKADLERVAAGVKGVVTVDNRLTVSTS